MTSQTILYGIHPVREALRAGRPVSRVYLLRGKRSPQVDALVLDAVGSGASIEYDSRSALDQIAQTEKHQGVVAIVASKGVSSLDQLLDRVKTATASWRPLFVVLDQVEDPQNLGAVIRTTEGSGAHGLIIPGRRFLILISPV